MDTDRAARADPPGGSASPPDAPRRLSNIETLRGMRRWTISSALSAAYAALTTGAFSTGFALGLGATNGQVGLLSAAPAWGQLIQGLSPLIIERLKRRKPWCVGAYVLSYGMWVPIALIPWLFHGPARAVLFIALVTLAGVMMAAAAPAGTSWLTDLVPSRLRARFMSRQQSVIAVVSLAASLLAGRYIDSLADTGKLSGFSALFVTAAVLGLAALVVWRFVPEPPKAAPRKRSAGPMLLLPFRDRGFRNLTLFVSARAFSVMVAAPFFTVYMLRNLNIPYSQIAVFSALSTVTTVLSNPVWAYLADKFGYRPILQICGTGLAVIPVGWFFTTHDNYVVLTPLLMLWAGATAAGLIMAQFNLVLAMAPEDSRSAYLGCHAAVVNLAIALGSATGGWLADRLGGMPRLEFVGLEVTNLHIVFLISACGRAMSQLLLRLVKEERAVPTRTLLKRLSRGRTLSAAWNLLRMSRSPDPAARALSVRALGDSHSDLPVEELVSLLNDGDRDLRREAARALGQIGDPRASEHLIHAALDEHLGIVTDAVEALGHTDTPEARHLLVTMARDERPDVRISAVLALGRIGGPEAVRALQALISRESVPAVFITAAEALSKAGGTGAIHPLRSLLARSDSSVSRREIANTLGGVLGDTSGAYSLLQADPMRQEEAAASIIRRGARLLISEVGLDTGDAVYVRTQARRATECLETGEWAEVVACLHRAATRGLHRASGSRRYTRAVSRGRGQVPPREANRRLKALLSAGDRLRASYGFLGGLAGDVRRREPFPEEALLAVLAFQNVGAELTRLRRERPGQRRF